MPSEILNFAYTGRRDLKLGSKEPQDPYFYLCLIHLYAKILIVFEKIVKTVFDPFRLVQKYSNMKFNVFLPLL